MEIKTPKRSYNLCNEIPYGLPCPHDRNRHPRSEIIPIIDSIRDLGVYTPVTIEWKRDGESISKYDTSTGMGVLKPEIYSTWKLDNYDLIIGVIMNH